MARSSTTFKPGMPSPCPGGRKRGISDVRELARTYTNEAIATLATIMMDPDAKESARIAAATALLERGWGKPEQAINIKPPELKVENMTTPQLYAMISQLSSDENVVDGEVINGEHLGMICNQ